MSALAKPRYTPEQCLARERQAEHKSEFHGGEIRGMAGASFTHNLLAANIVSEFRNQLRAGSCRPVARDQSVQVRATGLHTYPAVLMVCGEPQFTDDHPDTQLHPTLIVEVLSESPEAYDREEKFANYRRIESLSDDLLVAQNRRRIEQYARCDGQGVLSEWNGSDAVVTPSSIGCTLALADVYEQTDVLELLDAEADSLT